MLPLRFNEAEVLHLPANLDDTAVSGISRTSTVLKTAFYVV